MGEGFGDYLAGSFFLAKKKKATPKSRLLASVMSWNTIALWKPRNTDPPGRRLDSRATFDDFNEGKDEHDNGEIWSATLWDILQKFGRDTADRIIIESHFQLEAFSTFARAGRAILDADRNLFEGRHSSGLRRIFERRKIGPLS